MMLSMFEPMASAIHSLHEPPGTSGPDAHLMFTACDSTTQVQCSQRRRENVERVVPSTVQYEAGESLPVNPDDFAHAIAIVESGDNPNAPLGDHGRALGRYQMHPDFMWDWCKRLNIHPELNETWDSFQYRLILRHYSFYSGQGLTDVQCAMSFHEGHLCRERP